MVNLSRKEIDEVVDAILEKDDPRKRRNDPVDDFDSLCRVATFVLPGVRNLPGFVRLPPLPDLNGRHAAGREAIRFVGRYLEAINPTFSAFEWGRIYHHLLLRRNGRGMLVRIRQRPALAVREDAKKEGMTFEQLHAKYPDLKRSVLYRYLKEAKTARRQ